jgi:hypothetical protein
MSLHLWDVWDAVSWYHAEIGQLSHTSMIPEKYVPYVPNSQFNAAGSAYFGTFGTLFPYYQLK